MNIFIGFLRILCLFFEGTQFWTLENGDLRMVVSDWRRTHLAAMQGLAVRLAFTVKNLKRGKEGSRETEKVNNKQTKKGGVNNDIDEKEEEETKKIVN